MAHVSLVFRLESSFIRQDTLHHLGRSSMKRISSHSLVHWHCAKSYIGLNVPSEPVGANEGRSWKASSYVGKLTPEVTLDSVTYAPVTHFQSSTDLEYAIYMCTACRSDSLGD